MSTDASNDQETQAEAPSIEFNSVDEVVAYIVRNLRRFIDEEKLAWSVGTDLTGRSSGQYPSNCELLQLEAATPLEMAFMHANNEYVLAIYMNGDTIVEYAYSESGEQLRADFRAVAWVQQVVIMQLLMLNMWLQTAEHVILENTEYYEHWSRTVMSFMQMLSKHLTDVWKVVFETSALVHGNSNDRLLDLRGIGEDGASSEDDDTDSDDNGSEDDD